MKRFARNALGRTTVRHWIWLTVLLSVTAVVVVTVVVTRSGHDTPVAEVAGTRTGGASDREEPARSNRASRAGVEQVTGRSARPAPTATPASAAKPTAPTDSITAPADSTATPTDSITAPARPRRGAPEPSAGTKARPAALVLPDKGSGIFVPATGHTARFGSGPLIRYQVEVERDLPITPSSVARVVDATLRDPRSWAADGQATFQRVDGGEVEVHILVATADTTDRLCLPLHTIGELSCQRGDRVIFNAKRWTTGSAAFGKDVVNYRHYLVNHEVGHRLGKGHRGCPAAGQGAPVMMQQTKGVGSCKANPWPLPSELR